jgi:phage-related protein
MASPVADALTEVLNKLNEVLGQLGSTISGMLPNVGNVTKAFSQVGTAIQSIVSPTLQVISTFANLTSTLVSSLGKVAVTIGSIVPGLPLLATGLVTMAGLIGQGIGKLTAALGGVLIDGLSKLASTLVSIVPGLPAILSGLGAIGSGIKTALGALAPIVTGIFGQLVTTIGGALKGIGTAGGTAVAAIAKLGESIGGVVGGVLSLGTALAKFVELSNPGIVQLFTLAVRDMMGVIGQGMAPILRVVTVIIRAFADSLTTWVPQLGAVVAQIAAGLVPLFRILFGLLGTIGQAITLVVSAITPAIVALEQVYAAVYGALQPILETIVSILSGVLATAFKFLSDIVLQITPYILAVAKGMEMLFRWLEKTVRELFALIGLELPEFTKPKEGASVGAAVATGVNISGAADANVLKESLKNAFKGIGTEAKEDPIVKVAGIAEGLSKKADEILQVLFEMFNQGDEVVRNAISIYKSIVQVPDAVWNALPDEIKNIFRDLAKSLERLNPFGSGEAAKLGTKEDITDLAVSPVGWAFKHITKSRGAS